ncbi:MAG: hypothetical protein ACTSUC_01775 [Promethearchaeota archaeon]
MNEMEIKEKYNEIIKKILNLHKNSLKNKCVENRCKLSFKEWPEHKIIIKGEKVRDNLKIECKMCDYLIFTFYKNEIIICLTELKNIRIKNDDPILYMKKQLENCTRILFNSIIDYKEFLEKNFYNLIHIFLVHDLGVCNRRYITKFNIEYEKYRFPILPLKCGIQFKEIIEYYLN